MALDAEGLEPIRLRTLLSVIKRLASEIMQQVVVRLCQHTAKRLMSRKRNCSIGATRNEGYRGGEGTGYNGGSGWLCMNRSGNQREGERGRGVQSKTCALRILQIILCTLIYQLPLSFSISLIYVIPSFSLSVACVRGPLGPWAPGPLGPWAPGLLGPGPGPLGPWAPGPLGLWAPGPLGSWAPGPLGPSAPGPLGPWTPCDRICNKCCAC